MSSGTGAYICAPFLRGSHVHFLYEVRSCSKKLLLVLVMLKGLEWRMSLLLAL